MSDHCCAQKDVVCAQKEAVCDQFAAAHPDTVAQCEAAGIDWKQMIGSLWTAFGPMVMGMLQAAIQKWLAPAPTPTPTPAPAPGPNQGQTV